MDRMPVARLNKSIVEALSSFNSLILKAPPGSGKSTLVPQLLLDSVVPSGQSVVVLQPRRLATRMLARYVARLRNGKLGDEVGFQVRYESAFSVLTRLLFVTEGVLMRKLMAGDQLEGVGAVVFDEFHERHVETDITLALALELQKRSRNDLKLIAMSATADLEQLTAALPHARVLECEGSLFPVEIRHVTLKRNEPVWEAAVAQLAASRNLISEGTALVFMPGVFEIQKTLAEISKCQSLNGFDAMPLHSGLSREAQDMAVSEGRRRIVVTTNVAETSITIPGVSLVIDSGLVRVSAYDSKRDIHTLRTVFVSQSSAGQRSGRAGRTAPGLCIRLWSEFHHRQLSVADVPEIHRCDLAGVLLGLLSHPVLSPQSFPWIEPPTAEAFESAWKTLQMVSAIDFRREITSLGVAMSGLPLHPRQAWLFLLMAAEGFPQAGALAAVAAESPEVLHKVDSLVRSERDYLANQPESDLIAAVVLLLEAGRQQFDAEFGRRVGMNMNLSRQLLLSAASIVRQAGFRWNSNQAGLSIATTEALRKSIFKVYADRLCVRPDDRSDVYRLSGGRSAKLDPGSLASGSSLVVASEIDERQTSDGIRLSIRQATSVCREWVVHDESLFTSKQEVVIDRKTARVVLQRELYFGDLLFDRAIENQVDDEAAASRVAEAVLSGEWPWRLPDEEMQMFINRVNFAALHAPHYQIPAIDDDAFRFVLEQAFLGVRSQKELTRIQLKPHLLSWLSPLQLAAVDVVAPETVELPHRRRPVRLRYDNKGGVILSETIQAFYDCPTPVTVAEGRVEVMYELLSPARRPVQLTGNLNEFWTGSYPAIKKELKGRYPKHEWR